MAAAGDTAFLKMLMRAPFLMLRPFHELGRRPRTGSLKWVQLVLISVASLDTIEFERDFWSF